MDAPRSAPPETPTPEPGTASRPQRWHTATDFFCPRCRYDVSQTLADAIRVCPECGFPVSPESCVQVQRTLSALARVGLTVLWMSPLAVVPMLGGVAAVFGVDPIFAMLLIYALMIALCYLGWLWVERWILRRDAPRRAFNRTVVVVLIHMASAGLIFGILYWAATR